MFSTLVFYELEMEKSESSKKIDDGNQQAQGYDPSGMLNAINCFKDVSTTATFGKFGMKSTIGKRR